MRNIRRHPLLLGTAVLTATGLLSRLIGFFYRIYLARLFGEEGMGIYQLLSPITSLSFALAAAGCQTAISKLVAEKRSGPFPLRLPPLMAGLSISLPLSLICNWVIFHYADAIACVLLSEPRTAPMLRIVSFTVPLSAIHACINGYYYGLQKTGIPAATQLVEQLLRVGSVYGMSAWALSCGRGITIQAAILGLVIGEAGSTLLSLLSMCPAWSQADALRPLHSYTAPLYRPLLGTAVPLTANRIVLNLLQSVESVSIPQRLRLYGYDASTALSVYGVLTGMALPLVFFPNALTSSVAVLLLPTISEAYARKDLEAVRRNIFRTIKYCVLLGLACMACFVLFGGWAGERLFGSALAGHFIRTLGFLCPFLYLDTTLSSILQGLGMSGRVFLLNVSSLILRLGFVFLAVPHFGITGYLWGILASQALLTLLYLGSLFSSRRKFR